MSGFARRLHQAASGSLTVAGNVLAQDNFNRADGNLGTADIGGAWTTYVGTLTGTPAWGITSDMVAVSAAGGTDNWLSATLPLSIPSGTIFCDVYLSPNNANTGVCLFSSSDGMTYLNVQLNESVTYDRIALSKRVSGTTTWLQEIDNLNFANGRGYSMAVVFTGANVKVYLDGQIYLDYNLTSQDLTDLSGGTNVGLRSWFGPNDDDGGSRWNRFLVTDSTSTPAVRVPAAPWNVTAVNGGDGQADISWGRAGNGGTPLTGYVITSSDPGHTFTITDPNVMSFHATGLNNVAQTFTVQAVNAVGSSNATAPSAQSNSVTPAVATAPDAPTAVTATAGNAVATVSWTAPASDGGAPITSYTVTSSPGGQTATSTTTSATVTGLTNGTAYTFTVTATNSAGTSAASSPSGSVTPAAASGGSSTYGPDGTHWVPNTPTFSQAVSTSVEVDCTWAAIKAAIDAATPTQVANGMRIMVRPGTLTGNGSGSTATPAIQSTGSTSWTQRILIRPRDGFGTVTMNSVRIFRVYGTSWAGFQGGGIRFDSCINTNIARLYVTGGTFWINTTAGEPTLTGVTVAEVVKPAQALGDSDTSDCWPNTAAVDGIQFLGCYFAPYWRSTTSSHHSDSIQFEPFNGATVNNAVIKDCVFFGSSNSCIQINALRTATIDHCYIVANRYMSNRYPTPTNADPPKGWALNGGHGSPNLTVKDSAIIGGWTISADSGGTLINSITNVTVNAQPSFTGTYNVYPSLTDNNYNSLTGDTAPLTPETDYSLASIWSS